MEAALNAQDNYTSFQVVLIEEPGSPTTIGTAFNRVLKEDFLSRLPDLPRDTQLGLHDIFSADLWNQLTVEQRRAVASSVHFMAGDMVHLMPVGIGVDTMFSIHDCSSPKAEMAKEATWEWLRKDELTMVSVKQLMETLLEARRKVTGAPELDFLIEIIAMEIESGTSKA